MKGDVEFRLSVNAMQAEKRGLKRLSICFLMIIAIISAALLWFSATALQSDRDYRRMQNANHTENSVAFCEQNE
jgi:hypothetical protein